MQPSDILKQQPPAPDEAAMHVPNPVPSNIPANWDMHDTVDKVKAAYRDVLNDEHLDKPMRAPPVSFKMKKNIDKTN